MRPFAPVTYGRVIVSGRAYPWEERVANPNVSRVRFRAALSSFSRSCEETSRRYTSFTSLVKSREYALSRGRSSNVVVGGIVVRNEKKRGERAQQISQQKVRSR